MVCQALTTFFKENHEDMPKIDPSIMVHKLNVLPFHPSVRRNGCTPKNEIKL